MSADAHDYFLELMTYYNVHQPLLKMGIHVAVLCALMLFGRHRISQVYREMRIASKPPKYRKRQPEIVSVLDGNVALTMLVPAALAVLLSSVFYRRFASLPWIAVLLLGSGIMLYTPHFLQSANRDSRHLSRLEALGFGFSGALGVLPGFSGNGAILSVGALRGCGRKYMLDILLLFLVPLMAFMVVVDLIAWIAGGMSVTLLTLLQTLLAMFAAFGGACLAIASLRYFSVNKGYIAFSYYNWGLAFFGFILYLMI